MRLTLGSIFFATIAMTFWVALQPMSSDTRVAILKTAERIEPVGVLTTAKPPRRVRRRRGPPTVAAVFSPVASDREITTHTRGNVLDLLVDRPEQITVNQLLDSRAYNPRSTSLSDPRLAELEAILARSQPELARSKKKRGSVRVRELATLAAAGRLRRARLRLDELPPRRRHAVTTRTDETHAREIAKAKRRGRTPRPRSEFLRAFVAQTILSGESRHAHRDAQGHIWLATPEQQVEYLAWHRTWRLQVTAFVRTLTDFAARTGLLTSSERYEFSESYRARARAKDQR